MDRWTYVLHKDGDEHHVVRRMVSGHLSVRRVLSQSRDSVSFLLVNL